MDKQQWRDLFAKLEIDHTGIDNVLRYKDISLELYWKEHISGIGIYFEGSAKHDYPEQLWNTITDNGQVRAESSNRHNVVPIRGKEEEAFKRRIAPIELMRSI